MEGSLRVRGGLGGFGGFGGIGVAVLLLLCVCSGRAHPNRVNGTEGRLPESSSGSGSGSSWTKINPLITGTTLNSIAFGGGVYVATGTFQMPIISRFQVTIATTSDLALAPSKWSVFNDPSLFPQEPYGWGDSIVYWNGNLFLLIVTNTANNYCLVSDASGASSYSSWRQCSLPAMVSGCAAGSGYFACIHWTSLDVYFSTDGSKWLNSPSPFTYPVTPVITYIDNSFFLYSSATQYDSHQSITVYSYSLATVTRERTSPSWEPFFTLEEADSGPFSFSLARFNTTTMVGTLSSEVHGGPVELYFFQLGKSNSSEKRHLPYTIDNFNFVPSIPELVLAMKTDRTSLDWSVVYSKDNGKTWLDYGSKGPVAQYMSTRLWGVGNAFVTLGELGLIQFSTDAVQWQTVNNGFSLGFMDLVASPSTLVALGTEPLSLNTVIYQSADAGTTWHSVYQITDGNTILQWLPQINQWARFGYSLELSTNLCHWNNVSVLPSLLERVNYLGYYQGADEASSGWVVGAFPLYGFYHETAFELGFCDTQFSSCRAIEEWKYWPLPGGIAVGNNLLAFAVDGDTVVNFATLPLPQEGSIQLMPTKLPTAYQGPLANIFFANGYFFFWSSSVLAYSDGTSDWEVAVQTGINVVEYISELDLFVLVDEDGDLWTSTEGITGWASSVLSSGDHGISKIVYSNGYLVAVNTGDGAMYRLATN